MDPTYTGRKEIHRDGQDSFAEVTIRFLPGQGSRGVGFSAEAQRYLNSRFGADFSKRGDHIWQAVVALIDRSGRRLVKLGIWANTFRNEVVRVYVSENAREEDLADFLAGASKTATESFFADVDNGRVHFTAEDLEKPFELLPGTIFDEEFILQRKCFQEYVAHQRAGFLFGFAVSMYSISIEESREQRTLTACGTSIFRSAVCGYLHGCRPEADALVEKGYEMLTLADSIGEKSAGDYGSSWGRAERYAALAYLHWLKTGEEHERARAEARKAILSHGRRSKHFDRGSANLEAPQLLYLEAYSEIVSLWDRVSGQKGRGSARPGGLFGDALRIAMAEEPAERERLKVKLRKRIPPQLFRWMTRGNYSDVALLLHALFARLDGPPRGLIESAWNHLPEITRVPGYNSWDIKRK
jgi:hypothetical protein